MIGKFVTVIKPCTFRLYKFTTDSYVSKNFVFVSTVKKLKLAPMVNNSLGSSAVSVTWSVVAGGSVQCINALCVAVSECCVGVSSRRSGKQ